MEQEINCQPKKSFFKRFWWIFVILVILIVPLTKTIGRFIHNNPKRPQSEINQIKFPTSDVSSSNQSSLQSKSNANSNIVIPTALENGIIFNDATGDWVATGYATDNPSYYSVDYADLKSIVVANDDQNFYIKILVNGKFPKAASDFTAINGDQIKATSFSFVIDKTNTSVSPDIEVDYGLTLEGNEVKPFATYSTGATGIKQPEEKRFTNKYTDVATIGGMGEDFAILIIPFEKTGLKKGENITFSSSIETKSNKYHHASFDTLGSKNEKFPAIMN